ncbi:MAG: hypothetical protein IIX02_04595 [Clostridia bacterium]|jgi:hypothetical protein|nr:hypothetical protein [Clostridia bacterium]
MKRNRLALVALLFLTAVTLVLVGALAVQKQSPDTAVKTRNIERIERIFSPRTRFTP